MDNSATHAPYPPELGEPCNGYEWHNDTSVMPGDTMDSQPFLVVLTNDFPADYLCEVYWWEGNLYPSHLGGCIDWLDRIDPKGIKRWAHIGQVGPLAPKRVNSDDQ